MKLYLYILTFLLINFSCSQKKFERLRGVWKLDNNVKIETPFFPIELNFETDSLILIDDHHFKHQIRYQIIDDSIEMIFSNDNIRKLKFSFCSDSKISIGNCKFYKFPNDFENNVKPYEMIGYKTDEILIQRSFSNIIHLVKIDGQVKVILNDMTTDLEKIPDFLETNHGTPLPLILYLGKGLEFKDLVKAYLWIKLSNTHKVTLVTGNESFDKFYVLKDFIQIKDSLLENFYNRENIKHLSTYPIDNQNKDRTIIEINNKTDIEKLINLNDSTKYLIQVGNKLELIGYLELITKIRGKKNFKKIITAYDK